MSLELLEPHTIGLARQALDALQSVVRGGYGKVLGNEVVAGKAVLHFFYITALGHASHVLQKDNSHFAKTPRDVCATATALAQSAERTF